MGIQVISLRFLLTARKSAHTISRMNKKAEKNPSTELESLESQLQELLELCERLKSENYSLRDQQDTLSGERAALIEKNELARSRIEAMISRLKGMENSQ
jgi:cell division protein ZapB